MQAGESALSFEERETSGCIPDRFARVSASLPNHIAVRSLHHTLTYHDLDLLSNRLADFVHARLGGGQKPVALFLRDGADILAALLGVIRAGSFYSALQPRDPHERLAAVMKNLDAALLITDKDLLPLAQRIATPGCQVVTLAEAQGPVGPRAGIAIPPEDYAGVYFTSGSTGEPKGVLRTHRAILHRAWVDINDYHIGQGDRLLFTRPFNTSSSLSNLFDPLLSGASIIIYDMENDGIHRMAEVLDANEITIFVPPLEFLRYFLDILPQNVQFPHIRCVILSGDVLYRRDVERMRTHVSPRTVIIHHLSSSEGGLLARKVIESSTILDSNIIPVGYPAAAKELLILDEDRKEVGTGETGEIAVRTELIFPGYWHQPNLDNGKWMPDPADTSKRIFLTGDLGRFRPDGQLEFVGRKDFRVKIRGFSVDLSAIESILNSFHEVRRAVVLARENPNGEKRLTAYVSPMPGVELAPNTLRELLAARLPDFMLPKAIVILDQLPLTQSGKIDRQSLPVPDWLDQEISDAYVAPRDALEEKVTRIWEKTLNVPRAGIRDRFVDLGGDSLLAMAMFLELEKELGLRLPPSLLVDHDTVEKLVQALHQLDTLGVRSLVPLKPDGNRSPLYLIPGAFGDVSIWKQALPYFSEAQPIYGLQALRREGDSLYNLTVEQVASVFIQNIKDFQPEGPYYLAGYSFGGLIAFEIAHQMATKGDRVAFLGIVDSTAPGRRQGAKWTDRLRIHTSNLQALSWQERLKYLNESTARGLLRLSRRKILKEVIPVRKMIGSDHLKATSRASRSYFPDSRYAGAITVFKVSEEPWYVRWDRMKGWQTLVQGNIKIIQVPGNHANIMKAPQVRELALGLQTEIEMVS